ncbi:acyl-CoA thioesterase II [Flavobacteriaceae bacterium]|jgi:acyl-CoA thioesterase-2|nr:acyl-CoA thioesterase II [Flavobacteriaceae bacterium]MDA8644246.1 acyl-CoA thioesterase II [Flavobacteriaceae bacterium]MDA8877063.1 acyl-CoA thioesterase II [Flavobacteriaceae bacterium]MDA9037575.1 acyl-CoA thioesterase II [Flavobacteriaceae bacterium]MDA9588599.1 acyl-CoA thioesterase II [Flavobacteriaceae bacterium]
MITSQELIDLLTLEKKDDYHFIGHNYKTAWGRVFGGQVLGQSLHAAYQTVPKDRIAHSMHGYFILGGDINIPIDFHVDAIRDGRSFTTRRVVAFQKGKAIFNMAASFHIKEEGESHQIPMPNVLTPELLLTDIQQAEGLQQQDPERFLRLMKAHPQIFEFKPVDKAIYLQTQNSLPLAHIWFRIKDKIQGDLPLQHQILAFASDYSLLLSATLPHREKLMDAKMYYASLDHALWFHRDFKIDDWLLYAIESPSASNARGFSRGSIFDKNGVMVASVTQEGLMRRYK